MADMQRHGGQSMRNREEVRICRIKTDAGQRATAPGMDGVVVKAEAQVRAPARKRAAKRGVVKCV
jgi:hypothetical protein